MSQLSRTRTARITLGVTLVIATAAGLTACRSTTTEPDLLIRATGTIERSVEGCFRILTGTRAYQPLNLPAALQVDGLTVQFEARRKPTANTCMAGEVVELLSIRTHQP